MASQIQLTRSGISGVQPAASELEYGELALNYADGKLFYKDDANNLKALNDTYLNSNNTIYVNSINSAEPKIGLNTVSPEYLLDLGGDTGSTYNSLRINQNTNGTAIRIGASTSTDVTLMRVDSTNGATNNQGHGFSIDYLGVGQNNNKKLAIMADNQTGTAVQALTILQNGNIGIGTAHTPSNELEVGGSIKVTNSTNLMVFDDGEEAIGFINNNFKKLQINAGGSVDTLQLATNGSVALVIDNTQNVGIGNTSPNAKFDVTGGIKSSVEVITPIVRGPEVADALILRADPQSPDMEDGTGGDFGDGGAQISLHSSDSSVPNQIYVKSASTYFQNVNDDIVASIASIGTPSAATDLTTKAYVDGRITAAEYRPGEIIEGFSALCNGRSVTLTSGTYTIPAQNVPLNIDTAPLVGANEFTLYNGAVETDQRTNNASDADKTDDLRASIIKYKLPAGAKRVCYEFHCVMGRLDSYPIIEFSTFIGDGAGTDSRNANLSTNPGDETYTRLVGQAFTGPYAAVDSHIIATINLEITDVENEENIPQGIIYRGNWPAGGRTFIVNADPYSGSYEGKLYVSTHQDGVDNIYFTRPYMKITTYA